MGELRAASQEAGVAAADEGAAAGVNVWEAMGLTGLGCTGKLGWKLDTVIPGARRAAC